MRVPFTIFTQVKQMIMKSLNQRLPELKGVEPLNIKCQRWRYSQVSFGLTLNDVRSKKYEKQGRFQDNTCNIIVITNSTNFLQGSSSLCWHSRLRRSSRVSSSRPCRRRFRQDVAFRWLRRLGNCRQ